jgi:RimJ/RimL family protein N-acetyltransferase
VGRSTSRRASFPRSDLRPGPLSTLADHWPVAGLVVRTPRLLLRWPSDDDLVALADLAVQGIHGDDEMPFSTPWSRLPPGELELGLLRFHWKARASWGPELWDWNPVVVVDGEIVGTQGMVASHFPVLRTVATGSWLGRAHQGRGIGTEMRAAVLHLAFAGLGAERAETGAWDDNPASIAVTGKLGYRPNGDKLLPLDGRPKRQVSFALSRTDWERSRRDDIELEGLEPCLVHFGAGTES